MNTSSSQKIKTGAFVLVGILILCAGIFLIGAKKNMFSDTFNVYGTFKNAGGLQEGNNVRFGGVTIGTVKSIRIQSDTVVRVDMIIQSKMREFMKSDAVATVGSDGLMGDKLLTIQPGTPGAPVLKDGAKIPTSEPVDFGAIIAQFSQVATNAEVITGTLASMATQIQSGEGTIGRLMFHDDLARGLEGTMNNAQTITASMEGIASQVRSGRGSIGSLLYTTRLSDSLERTVGTANYALATVQKAADNFSENMKALQGNFFFRGYFKKKAKASGQSDPQTRIEEPSSDEDEVDMSDEELQQLRDDAEKELQRRKSKTAPAAAKK